MKKVLLNLILVLIFCAQNVLAQSTGRNRKTWYNTIRHDIRWTHHYAQTDTLGNILPWLNSEELGESYDLLLNLLWNFWDNIPYVYDGVKYYMIHREWPYKDFYTGIYGGKEDDGIGGGQIQMCLDSWTKWYQYSGIEKVKENMIYMADFYLDHGLSSKNSIWPGIPYPWHTKIEPGLRYDGDLRDGINVTQIDKAGDFAYQLINLYKMTGYERYKRQAINIAVLLASNTQKGNMDKSPLPYKVNTETGEIIWDYTANWAWTLRLFDEILINNWVEDKNIIIEAGKMIKEWIKEIAIPNKKYGPFFEDISTWSNTGINAGRTAEYILEQGEKWDKAWKEDARKALDFLIIDLGNDIWEESFGFRIVNEQSAYMFPGNSHTARHAYLEILYWMKTGDNTWLKNALNELNWATYSIDHEGRNEYPGDPIAAEIWFTDGYGDYIIHFLKAMATYPEKLAPTSQNHMTYSTSVISNINYSPEIIHYKTFDAEAEEMFVLIKKPERIEMNGFQLKEMNSLLTGQGWNWRSLDKGGILRIKHQDSNIVTIYLN